jgi:hypothetical protein
MLTQAMALAGAEAEIAADQAPPMLIQAMALAGAVAARQRVPAPEYQIGTLATHQGVVAEVRRVQVVGPQITTQEIALAAGAVPRVVAVALQILIQVISRGKGGRVATIPEFPIRIRAMGQGMAGAARCGARLILATRILAVFAAEAIRSGWLGARPAGQI